MRENETKTACYGSKPLGKPVAGYLGAETVACRVKRSVALADDPHLAIHDLNAGRGRQMHTTPLPDGSGPWIPLQLPQLLSTEVLHLFCSWGKTLPLPIRCSIKTRLSRQKDQYAFFAAA